MTKVVIWIGFNNLGSTISQQRISSVLTLSIYWEYVEEVDMKLFVTDFLFSEDSKRTSAFALTIWISGFHHLIDCTRNARNFIVLYLKFYIFGFSMDSWQVWVVFNLFFYLYPYLYLYPYVLINLTIYTSTYYYYPDVDVMLNFQKLGKLMSC